MDDDDVSGMSQQLREAEAARNEHFVKNLVYIGGGFYREAKVFAIRDPAERKVIQECLSLGERDVV